MEKFIIIVISAVAAITMILLFYNSGNASKAAKELYNQYYESKRNEVLTAMLDNRAAFLRAELESKRDQLLFQNKKMIFTIVRIVELHLIQINVNIVEQNINWRLSKWKKVV